MSSNATTPNLSVPPMVVPAHNLARWIHARLEVTDGVMRWESPRALLGIVPVGRRRVDLAATEVSNIRLRRATRPINLLIGLTVMVVPVLVGWGWWMLLTVPLGLWIVLVSLGPRMDAITDDGRTYHVDGCFGHQIDAELYMAAVEDIAGEAGARPQDPGS